MIIIIIALFAVIKLNQINSVKLNAINLLAPKTNPHQGLKKKKKREVLLIFFFATEFIVICLSELQETPCPLEILLCFSDFRPHIALLASFEQRRDAKLKYSGAVYSWSVRK